MTEIDLGLAGLPELEPIPFILAIEREGWSVGVGSCNNSESSSNSSSSSTAAVARRLTDTCSR